MEGFVQSLAAKERRKKIREKMEGVAAGSVQSLAAKERRKKIREKMLELGGLIPGGSNMNTAEMLQTAFNYVKFLQAQLDILMLPVTHPNSISNAVLPCPDLIQLRTEYPIGQCSHAPYIEAPDFPNSLPILNIDSSSALLEPVVMPISELSDLSLLLPESLEDYNYYFC